MNHIFTYGSLMFNQVWANVVRGSYEQHRGTLTGYVRRCIINENYPAILPGPLTSTVSGIIYLNVTSEDIHRLDAFEGSYYFRKSVQVSTENNIFAADTYVLKNSYRHITTDNEWDPEEFEKEGIHLFLGSYFGFDT